MSLIILYYEFLIGSVRATPSMYTHLCSGDALPSSYNIELVILYFISMYTQNSYDLIKLMFRFFTSVDRMMCVFTI